MDHEETRTKRTVYVFEIYPDTLKSVCLPRQDRTVTVETVEVG